MKKAQQTVLVVDDVPKNIDILDGLLSTDYRIKVAISGQKALEIAFSDSPPDLILLDIMMPEMDGYEVCKRLHENTQTKNIPIIFVTALHETADEVRGLELGAVDFIAKPYVHEIVKKRVSNHLELKKYRDSLEDMVRERTAEVVETRLEIIRKLGIAAEFKDNETGSHIIRMSRYSQVIALALGLPADQAELILFTAPMHDIGKIGIADHILLKPGPLNDDEMKIMRTHCAIGAKIIGDHPSELLQAARTVAMTHHEKWDGTGYPRMLKGENIDLYGRIVAIADVFDALTSKRPYKDAWPLEKALDLVKKESGRHFDPTLVPAFFEALPEVIKIRNEIPE